MNDWKPGDSVHVALDGGRSIVLAGGCVRSARAAGDALHAEAERVQSRATQARLLAASLEFDVAILRAEAERFDALGDE